MVVLLIVDTRPFNGSNVVFITRPWASDIVRKLSSVAFITRPWACDIVRAFMSVIIGAPAGDEEALINPLLRFSSNHSLTAFSSRMDNKYIGPNGGVNPSSNVIL